MTAGAWNQGRSAVVWGACTAVVYLVAAVLSVTSGLVKGRPLYDGLPKEPYRWVDPPAERVEDNKAPMGAEATLALNTSGQPDPGSVSTGDVQATVIFERVDPKEYSPGGPTGMKVTITPVDPTTVGARPQGRYFDSNAYRIEATYPSGAPVLAGRFDIVLTYAVHSTDIRRWNGSEWTRLDRASADRSTLQIYSFTPALGTFVATGEGDVPREPEAATPGRPVLVYVVLGLGAGIGCALAVVSGRRRQSRTTPPPDAAGRGRRARAGAG